MPSRLHLRLPEGGREGEGRRPIRLLYWLYYTVGKREEGGTCTASVFSFFFFRAPASISCREEKSMTLMDAPKASKKRERERRGGESLLPLLLLRRCKQACTTRALKERGDHLASCLVYILHTRDQGRGEAEKSLFLFFLLVCDRQR